MKPGVIKHQTNVVLSLDFEIKCQKESCLFETMKLKLKPNLFLSLGAEAEALTF